MDSKKSAQTDSKWQADVDQSKWPAYEIYPASMWNYGLVINDKSVEEQIKIIKRPWPNDNYPFTPEATPIKLTTAGKIIPQWTLDKYRLCGTLPQSPVTVSTKEETVELIPMGAARLRISALPVVR